MKRKRRVRCPRCGQLALEVRRYTNGDVSYNHAMHAGPFGFIEVTESCYISAKKAAAGTCRG